MFDWKIANGLIMRADLKWVKILSLPNTKRGGAGDGKSNGGGDFLKNNLDKLILSLFFKKDHPDSTLNFVKT